MSRLSDVLKRRRKDLDLTLAQIADMMGVAEATVQRWESGNIKSVRYDKITKLADILRVAPATLMGWDEEGSPQYNYSTSQNTRFGVKYVRGKGNTYAYLHDGYYFCECGHPVFTFTQSPQCSEVKLTEQDVIELYRRLDSVGRDAVCCLLKNQYLRSTQSRPISVYSYPDDLCKYSGLPRFDAVASEICIPCNKDFDRVDFALRVSGAEGNALYDDGDIILLDMRLHEPGDLNEQDPAEWELEEWGLFSVSDKPVFLQRVQEGFRSTKGDTFVYNEEYQEFYLKSKTWNTPNAEYIASVVCVLKAGNGNNPSY